jgi:PTS system glucose-specific IIA component
MEMFGLFNRKKLEIYAPAPGEVIDIIEVADAVFSAKMLGDGFAVEPQEDFITAPCDGTITLLAGTKHAIALETDGIEILIHVGLDTVELKGEGFEAFVKQQDQVKRGDKLISFDRDFIEGKGKKLTTMLVLTNMDKKIKSISKNLQAKDGKILAIEPK